MKKGWKHLRLMVGISVMLALLSTVPVVHAGLLWTGIDPVLLADGHIVNIWVEWPTGRECDITGPISVSVRAEAVLLAESIETFGCGDATVPVSTTTSILSTDEEDEIKIKRVYVPADASFPVRVKVYDNGDLALTCMGYAGQAFTCPTVELDD